MKRTILSFLMIFIGSGFAASDEGMWTFDNLPVKALQERYSFTASAEWLDHARLSSVRFNDGGSGAFVSPDGLVLTNHHVALGQLQKVSTAERDFVKDGFYARKAQEELKCPDLELNVLQSSEEVTARVLAKIDPKASEKERNEARKAEMARIEKESTDATGLRSDVVELYQGGEYWLYRYKKFKDIRLVMAPEAQAAFYGGDPDNFTFPRYDLDFAFFRVYEDGKALKPAHWLRWSKAGAGDGELVFVTGHPGSTDRLKTGRQLRFERELRQPLRLKMLGRRRAAYYAYSARGVEQTRRAKDRIFSVENSIKAISGEAAALKTPELRGGKEQDEAAFRALVAKDPKLASAYGDSWDKLAKATDAVETRYKQLFYRQRMFGSKLADFAGMIVRLTAEVEKPNEKRYEEFRDSALDSLKFRLFSPAPVYADMEEALLADILGEALEELGPADPHVKAALGGGEPKAVAAGLIGATKLTDAAERKRLVEGGAKAVEASTDPLIVWARALDPHYRELRDWYEGSIQPIEVFEGNKIAKARFAVYGKSVYPDATFTLRLSYGKVAGYDQGTNRIPYKTAFGGLYARASEFDGKPPFDLPARVSKARSKVDLDAPLNLVTTNDIIGGNSGSPVINRDGEYVGLIFDGNIQGLVGRYGYAEDQARAVAVHSAGILEALKSIYGMDAIVAELTKTKS